jgi:hypothetical protein
MLRLALASMLFISNIAASQAAKQACINTPNATSSLSAVLNCLGASPATGFSLEVCGQEDRRPIKLNQGEVSTAASPFTGLPDAPSAFWAGPNSTDGALELVNKTRFVPPTLAMERNTNRGWHTLDRKFILLQTLSTVALFADIETTAHALAAHPNAIELNPLFGQHPSPVRLYGTGVAFHALTLYLSYHAKKVAPRRNVWKVAPTLSIAVHTAAAINNLMVAQ